MTEEKAQGHLKTTPPPLLPPLTTNLKLLGGLRASREKQDPHLVRSHRKQGFVQAHIGTAQ